MAEKRKLKNFYGWRDMGCLTETTGFTIVDIRCPKCEARVSGYIMYYSTLPHTIDSGYCKYCDYEIKQEEFEII